MTFNNLTSKNKCIPYCIFNIQTVTYADWKKSKGYKYMADYLNGTRNKELPDSKYRQSNIDRTEIKLLLINEKTKIY